MCGQILALMDLIRSRLTVEVLCEKNERMKRLLVGAPRPTSDNFAKAQQSTRQQVHEFMRGFLLMQSVRQSTRTEVQHRVAHSSQPFSSQWSLNILSVHFQMTLT